MGKIVDGIFYSSEGEPTHAGIVEVDGKIYYAGKNGVIAKDQKKIIHHGMANGLVKHGRYYFDKNGVIRKSSFVKEKTGKKALSKKEKAALTKKISIIAAALIAFAMLVFGVVEYFKNKAVTPSAVVSGAATPATYEIVLPQWDEEVYLCTAPMKKYYQGEISLLQVAQSKIGPYQPFQFKYRMHDAVSAMLLLSEQDDYSDSMKYDLDVNADYLNINNLKTATTYYYLVVAKDENGKTHADGGEFTTADTNRFIYLPGVYNTRDIGGYRTLDGKRVKQGLLFRGTELDGLVKGKYFLSDLNAVEPLGIVYDFDLRSNTVINTTYVSRLGVPHKFYDSPEYGGIFSKSNEAKLREIFADLANERHYPMYLHSTYGADRTGTIVFLLQGILGVSEEDMGTEYSLTCFLDDSYVNRPRLQTLYAGLQGIPGETINEKIESFLVDTVGVSLEQIQTIRSIFLEDE